MEKRSRKEKTWVVLTFTKLLILFACGCGRVIRELQYKCGVAIKSFDCKEHLVDESKATTQSGCMYVKARRRLEALDVRENMLSTLSTTKLKCGHIIKINIYIKIPIELWVLLLLCLHVLRCGAGCYCV